MKTQINKINKNKIGSMRCKACDNLLKEYEDKYCSDCESTEIINIRQTEEILDDIA